MRCAFATCTLVLPSRSLSNTRFAAMLPTQVASGSRFTSFTGWEGRLCTSRESHARLYTSTCRCRADAITVGCAHASSQAAVKRRHKQVASSIELRSNAPGMSRLHRCVLHGGKHFQYCSSSFRVKLLKRDGVQACVRKCRSGVLACRIHIMHLQNANGCRRSVGGTNAGERPRACFYQCSCLSPANRLLCQSR
jgi:hypothetical protein